MSPIRSVGFISEKGGQGVTTTACAFAVMMSATRPVVIAASVDTRACLGLPEDATHANDRLRVVDVGADFDSSVLDELVVYDGLVGDYTVLVTRPCYLSLRRAVCAKHPYDGIVVLREEARALTDKDVERALGRPVLATVEVRPVVARAVDAGVLAARLPQAVRDELAPLVNSLEMEMLSV